MTIKNEAERLARAWIDGWNAGQPDELPLAPSFTHTSPFGQVKGREKYLECVKPLAAKNVSSLEIVKIIGGEEEAVIWFEMTTPNGIVPCCDWVQIRSGKIVAITSFYDATGLRQP